MDIQELGTVLIVDDSRLSREVIKDELAGQNGQFLESDNASTALAMVAENCVDLILLDIYMPEVSGLEALDVLQSDPKTRHIPVIMLTGQGNESVAVDAMKRGAKDYLVKGTVTRETLQHAITNVMDKCALEREIARRQRRLEYLARTDALTGIMNRRCFFDHFERELKRAKRHRTPLACVLLDIDFFKRINDDRGHVVGDVALRMVAQCLESGARETDFICRYGGEELCALLTETNEQQAFQWAERLRSQLAQLDIPDGNGTFSLTASFGVACRIDGQSKTEDMIELADQALACAKASGRNRVVSYSELVNASPLDAFADRAVDAPLHGVVVGDIMASPASCLPQTATLQQAAEAIAQLRVNAVAVVDEDNRLVGMVSEKDLIVAFSPAGARRRSISEIMTRNVVQFEEDVPAQRVFDLFCRDTIRRLVVTREGQPVGMVSRTALLRWLGNWVKRRETRLDERVEERRDEDSERTQTVVLQAADVIQTELEDLQGKLKSQGSDATYQAILAASKLQGLADKLLLQGKAFSHGTHEPAAVGCASLL